MNVNSWVLFFAGWAWFSYNILPCAWWILTIIHILCSTLKGTLCFFVFLVIKSSHSTFLHVVVKTLHKTWLSSKHCCSWNKMDGLAILPWEQVISVCHGEISCALLSLLKWCRQIEVFPGVVNIFNFFFYWIIHSLFFKAYQQRSVCLVVSVCLHDAHDETMTYLMGDSFCNENWLNWTTIITNSWFFQEKIIGLLFFIHCLQPRTL